MRIIVRKATSSHRKRNYAEKVVVVARNSKMTLKSDTLAVKRQLSYERRLLPIQVRIYDEKLVVVARNSKIQLNPSQPNRTQPNPT